MEQSTARENAIAAVTGWQSNGTRINFKETPVRQLFGTNVFSEEVMRARLPEQWTLESFPFKKQPGVSQKQMRGFAELHFVAKAAT